MLMRFEPFRAFDRATEEFQTRGRGRLIPADAYRRGDEFKVHLDLPGVHLGSIELTVEADVLSVRATRAWAPAEGDLVQISERPQGEFSRRLLLGERLDRDNITAAFDDGVLTITIPVTEQAKSRKVEVTHAGTAQALQPASAAA